jgi:hypothetical protein
MINYIFGLLMAVITCILSGGEWNGTLPGKRWRFLVFDVGEVF